MQITNRIGLIVRSRKFKAGIIPILALLVALIAWLADRESLRIQASTYLFSAGFIANSLPIVLGFFALLVITRRAIFSTISSLTIIIAICAINRIKLATLQQPITFNDAYFLKSLDFSELRLLTNYLSVKLIVVPSVLILLLTAIFIREPPIIRKYTPARLASAAIVMVLMSMLAMRAAPFGEFYNSQRLRLTPWWLPTSQLHAGIFGVFIHGAYSASTALDEPIDGKAIHKFINLPDAGPGHASKRSVTPALGNTPPDIIIVQSESFFDPAILKDIDNTSQLLPYLHLARQRGRSGEMAVPTFGGGTLRTEFEVLTSIPLAAFPKIEFPYLEIQTKKYHSLPRVLGKMGYETVAIHPNRSSFWNRKKAFVAMGFDKFDSLRNFPSDSPKDGLTLSDSAFTDKIISTLKLSKSPTFIFGISMEGHGPYEDRFVNRKDVRNNLFAPKAWSEKSQLEFRDYTYHISHADAAFGRLWQFLQDRKHPYVLIFYGDHLPGFVHVYNASEGFDNGGSALSQGVPWVMVGNNVGGEPNKQIYSWMLGSEILCEIGAQLPPYYALIEKAQGYQSDAVTPPHVDETVQKGVQSLARTYLEDKQFSSDVLNAAVRSTCGSSAMTADKRTVQ